MHGLPEQIEDRLVGPLGVDIGLHHQRRHGTDKDGFLKTDSAMLSKVMGDLSSSIRVANHHCVFDLQMRKKFLEVIDKGIYVISILGLG